MNADLDGFRLICTSCENEGAPALIGAFDTHHQAAIALRSHWNTRRHRARILVPGVSP